MLGPPLLPFGRGPRRLRCGGRAGGRRIAALPLPAALAAYALALGAFWLLVCARGYDGPPAGTLRSALGIEPGLHVPLGAHLSIFALLALAQVTAWVVSVRAAARAAIGIRGVLATAAGLSVPLLLLTGIYSDDVYLYNMYGRTLAIHGANPFMTPPSAFPADPHLTSVYWKWLPSAYGPLWIAVSAPLSFLGASSVNLSIVMYRLAGLAAHLAASWIIWRALRPADERRAVLAAAFFAWNPFVLFESVASAHNDALLVAFVCLALWAVRLDRWGAAGASIAAAAMVKPFAVILLLPVVAVMWVRTDQASRTGRTLRIGAAAALVALACCVPFGAGTALLANIASNPASGTYMNTPWELAVTTIARYTPLERPWLEAVVFDRARVLMLAAAVAGALIAAVRTRQIAASALALWIGFCFSLSWIWPWYFVPIVALAAFSGPRAQALATACSVAGLVFYIAWPPPSQSLSWIYMWRAVWLFGPPAVVLALWGRQLLSERAPRQSRSPAAGNAGPPPNATEQRPSARPSPVRTPAREYPSARQ